MAKYKNPQSSIRWTLQQHGYCWVPNNGKRTRGRQWPEKSKNRGPKTTQGIKSWDEPGREINGEWVDLANPSTGILIEGDLVAIDVDVDNEDAVLKLFDLATRLFGDEWQNKVLVRHRANSRKEAWLFRLEPPRPGDEELPGKRKFTGPLLFEPNIELPEGMSAGGTYTKPDGWTSSIKGHRVEFFRGGKCQIGAFGWHTLPGEKGDGEPGVEYQWLEDQSPATVPRWDLPVVPYGAFREFVLTHADMLIDKSGWQVSKHADDTGGGDRERRYTLDTRQTFYTGTSRNAVEPVDYEGLDKDMPVRVAEVLGVDPRTDGSNPARGFVTERFDGVMGICDSETGITYYPPYADPDQATARVAELGEAIGRLGLGSLADEETGDPLPPIDEDDLVDEDQLVIIQMERILAENNVVASIEDEDFEAVWETFKRDTRDWHGDEDDPQIQAKGLYLALRWMFVRDLDAKADQRWRAMIPGHSNLPISEFVALYNVSAGAVKTVKADGSPVIEWKPVTKRFADGQLQVRVQGGAYGPGRQERITKAEDTPNLYVVNTYNPPKLGTVREELVDLFDELLHHIFDHEEERAIFDECVSYKFLNLEARGVAHFLIADGIEGVGRNTLIEGCIFPALGAENCMKLPKEKLQAENGQSSYTAWQYNRLAWFSAEMANISRRGLEMLKELAEVSSEKTSGTEKGGKDVYDKVYGTFFGATNEVSSVALDLRTDNRRFNFYSNGAKGSLADNEALYQALSELRGNGMALNADMAASVHHYYREVVPQRLGRAPSKETFLKAQMTPTKRLVSEMSKKPSDHYIEDVLEEADSRGATYLEYGDVERAVLEAAKANDVDRRTFQVIRDELQKQTKGTGFKGWVRVVTDQGSPRVKVAGNVKKSVLAKGKAAAQAFLDMGLVDRSAALTYKPPKSGSNVTAITPEQRKALTSTGKPKATNGDVE